MSILQINVEPREEIGTRACRRLRKAGSIPVNLYSGGKPAMSLKLDGQKWAKFLTDQLNIVELTFPDGKNQMAAPREIQKDPLTQEIVHVDFQGVKMDTAAEFHVAIEFVGVPVGIKEGGVQTISADFVAIECLPTKVPDSIPIDISHLQIGQNVTAADLELPEGLTLKSDPAIVLLGVTVVRQVEEEVKEEVPEGEEGAEAAAGEEGAVEDEKTEETPSE